VRFRRYQFLGKKKYLLFNASLNPQQKWTGAKRALTNHNRKMWERKGKKGKKKERKYKRKTKKEEKKRPTQLKFFPPMSPHVPYGLLGLPSRL
jgi:hypothetical protein